MSNDIVSVVIPVFNSEKFLKNCIDSIINQTYDNTEIIAVDDGSTDGSLKILQKYDSEITIIHQDNQGLANALNSSIKKMNGKWFKWISPDDMLYPQAVESLVKEATKFQEKTIIYSNWELINENNETLRSFSESNYNDLEIFDFNIRLLDGQQINVNTTLIPSSLFKEGCLFQQLKDPVAIDYDFFLRAGILHKCKFHLFEDNLVKYRIHSNQLSHKNISKTISYLTEVKEKILSSLDNNMKIKYQKGLEEYKITKSFSKKTKEMGLKFSSALPDWLSDRLVVFYLNRIRSAR